MGPRYALGGLLALLAAGHLMYIVQQPAINILAGIDRHGPPALVEVAASGMSVALCIVALWWLGLGLYGAAVAIGLPLTIVHGVYLPIYVCRQVDLPLKRYLVSVWARPLLCVMPLTLCLVGLRLLLPEHALRLVISSVCIGGVVLLVTYWNWVMPSAFRRDVKRGIARKLARLSS
jgi:O-antigen/teichoic acid export membrane protein